MDFERSEISGTDDDLRSSHLNKFRSRGPAVEKTRGVDVGTAPFHRMQNMEVQIHHIELDAYSSVLRAFKAQSDAITWEMESLITELRKELRVTDDEHRKLLSRVNADDMIQRIREWRKGNGLQPGLLNCPTTSASYKKQKTSKSGASLYLGPPPMAPDRPVQTPASAVKRVSGSGLRTNKLESYVSTGFTGRDQVHKQGLGGASNTEELDRSDPLVGRKVWTRWSEDNNFYEAVISDFNAIEGRHALVYDAGTPNETWEWVNFREISSNDIRWKKEDAGISHRGGQSGFGRGIKTGPCMRVFQHVSSHRASNRQESPVVLIYRCDNIISGTGPPKRLARPWIKKSMAYGGITTGSGRGNGILKGQSKNEIHPSQYGIGRKPLNDLEILHTDTLVKEVDKVFSSSHADPMDIMKARKILKDHEQALLDAIAKLEGISDGESDREKQKQYQLTANAMQPIFPGNISRKYEVDEGSNVRKVSENSKRQRNGPNHSFNGHGMP